MNRLIVADIKSPVTNGQCMGHFLALARNYHMVFRKSVNSLIAGGPIYKTNFAHDVWFPLPYNLEMVHESKFVNKFKYFVNAWHLFRNCHEDIMVVQQGGDVTFFIACALLYRRYRRNRLYLIQYSTTSLRSGFKRMIFKLAKRKLDGIICPNDEVGKAFDIPYCVVPDYFYINETAQKPMPSYVDKKYDVCILGRIEEEKGVVESVRRLKEMPLKVIVAGNANAQIEKELKNICSEAPNITLDLRYISDSLYVEYIRQSRFCLLNYSDEYSVRSSGAVYDMLYNQVPIIGRRCRALRFVSDLGMGYLYEDVWECDETIFSEANYTRFMAGINKYLSDNVAYQRRLAAFIGVDITNGK